MKFRILEKIIKEKATQLELEAEYSGAWGVWGSSDSSSLLNKLYDYKNGIVVKHDLRPSEFYKIDDMEIGEPNEFKIEITEYKVKLAKSIQL